jgi:hypothetical protein
MRWMSTRTSNQHRGGQGVRQVADIIRQAASVRSAAKISSDVACRMVDARWCPPETQEAYEVAMHSKVGIRTNL